MLVIALVAVVGFAAFSPSSGGQPTTTTLGPEASAPGVSARVASAILAIRVSEPETRTASTLTTPTTVIDEESQSDSTLQSNAADESTTTTEGTTTSLGTTTSATATTTAPERDTTPPALRVTSPKDGSTIDDRIVTFSGTTEPGADVTSGPYAAEVDDDGSWSIQLVLSPGPNGALFTATDDDGNTATVRIVVTYDAPAPTTTSAPTTTTQPPSATTTTAGSTEQKWSPLWPADAGGKRNVEHWRPLVEKYWPAELVSCALNIIDLESEGDPRAWNSSAGAEGLFQHLSKYWKNRAASAGFKDDNGLYATPYNAEANIAAAWYIAKNASPWHRPWSVNPFYGDCQS